MFRKLIKVSPGVSSIPCNYYKNKLIHVKLNIFNHWRYSKYRSFKPHTAEAVTSTPTALNIQRDTNILKLTTSWQTMHQFEICLQSGKPPWTRLRMKKNKNTRHSRKSLFVVTKESLFSLRMKMHIRQTREKLCRNVMTRNTSSLD